LHPNNPCEKQVGGRQKGRGKKKTGLLRLGCWGKWVPSVPERSIKVGRTERERPGEADKTRQGKYLALRKKEGWKRGVVLSDDEPQDGGSLTKKRGEVTVGQLQQKNSAKKK